ncbi:hypothetical protein [Brevundimonas diminuta]|uniref:hypothetical protein n=1 Tax=Brevundimonas diminuta TaxID=293 RepID=UPI003D015EFF
MKEEFKRFSANGKEYVDDGVQSFEVRNGKVDEDPVEEDLNWAYVSSTEVSTIKNGPLLNDRHYTSYVVMKNAESIHVIGHPSEILRMVQDHVKMFKNGESGIVALDPVDRVHSFPDYLQGKLPKFDPRFG